MTKKTKVDCLDSLQALIIDCEAAAPVTIPARFISGSGLLTKFITSV
ncbi:hypothetical protein [Candidatus Chlamydia corallus]|nr:hypothetical protein [Candidatus Chlamydia corallus]